jgi:hypothetical protein
MSDQNNGYIDGSGYTDGTFEKAYIQFLTTLNKTSLRYKHTEANALAIHDHIVAKSGESYLAYPDVWLAAWGQVSAAGLLEEPTLSETERQQIAQDFNARSAAAEAQRVSELEKRDRAAGNMRRYRSPDEQSRLEQQELDAAKEGSANLRKIVRRAGEKLLGGEENGLSPRDAAAELTQLLEPIRVSSSTAEHKRSLRSWMRNTPNQTIVAVSKQHPELRTKLDAILAKPDPLVDL